VLGTFGSKPQKQNLMGAEEARFRGSERISKYREGGGVISEKSRER